MTHSHLRVVVVGASAGAVDCLSAILPGLPAGYGLPIVIVVHVPPQRDSCLAELFQAKAQLTVVEAQDKDTIRAGSVYFAPPDYHVLLEQDMRISLSSDEAVHFSRPSIDVLFETAADALDDAVLGVVLSGANCDGAHGLRTILAAGGCGLILNPDNAYATAMPLAAIEACPSAEVLDLPGILKALLEAGKS